MSENEHADGKMVDAKLVENNRCYLTSVAQAVACLVISRRHNREIQDSVSQDLFNSFYQQALGEDKSLTDITDMLPPEAQYTSEDFQMMVVRTLAQMVRDKIRQRYEGSDSKSYCIKGCIQPTQDQGEVMSLAIRFMNEGKPEEHLIGQVQLEQSDADYIVGRILSHLSENGLNPQNIVGQCYNSATSFSGYSRGLHAALQVKLAMCIPNIHCDHRPLSLVLIHTFQDVPITERFLNACDMLCKFLQHPHITQRNDIFTPLQETLSDPSVFYHFIQNIVSNFNSIYGVIFDVSRDASVLEELLFNASDLVSELRKPYFFPTAMFVLDLLTAAQLTEVPFAGFLPHTPDKKYLPFDAEATQAAWWSMRGIHNHSVCLAEYYTAAKTSVLSEAALGQPVPKHPGMLDFTRYNDLDYAIPHTSNMADTFPGSVLDTPESDSESVLDTSDSDGESVDTDSSSEENREFHPVELKVFDTFLSQGLDVAIHEMQSRLPQEDQALLEAICVLFPSSPKFLDMDVCLPLLKIARVCRISLAKEIQEAKRMLSEILASMTLAEACEVVYNHSNSFPALYEVYVAAVLMAMPRSDCERSFPVPVQTLSEHDINVAIVAHEHVITSGLCPREFVVAFSRTGTPLLL